MTSQYIRAALFPYFGHNNVQRTCLHIIMLPCFVLAHNVKDDAHNYSFLTHNVHDDTHNVHDNAFYTL